MSIVSFVRKIVDRLAPVRPPVPLIMPLRKLTRALTSTVADDVLGALARLQKRSAPCHVNEVIAVLSHENEDVVHAAVDLLLRWQIVEAAVAIDRALRRLDRHILRSVNAPEQSCVGGLDEDVVADARTMPCGDVPLLALVAPKSAGEDREMAPPSPCAAVTMAHHENRHRLSMRRLRRLLVDPDANNRIGACVYLAKRMPRQAWRLLPLLDDEDARVRQGAGDALTRLRGGELKHLLTMVLMRRHHPHEVRWLLRCAQRVPRQHIVLPLASLVDRMSSMNRRRVIRFLLRHPVVELAEQLAEWSRHESQRLLAQVPAGSTGGREMAAVATSVSSFSLADVMMLRRREWFTLARLNGALLSSDDRVRACAIMVMPEHLDFFRVVETLRALAQDSSSRVRDAVLTSLEAYSRGDVEILKTLSADTHDDIRHRACSMLARAA